MNNHNQWSSPHSANMLEMLVVLRKAVVGGLKAPTAILVRLHSHPPKHSTRISLTSLTQKQAALTHSQHGGIPAHGGHLNSGLDWERMQPSLDRVQFLPWNSDGDRPRSCLLRLQSGGQLTLGWAAPRLHVALKRVVNPEQLAGFIRSTFSDPEKQPGSLRALPALRCTFSFLYDQQSHERLQRKCWPQVLKILKS